MRKKCCAGSPLLRLIRTILVGWCLALLAPTWALFVVLGTLAGLLAVVWGKLAGLLAQIPGLRRPKQPDEPTWATAKKKRRHRQSLKRTQPQNDKEHPQAPQ